MLITDFFYKLSPLYSLPNGICSLALYATAWNIAIDIQEGVAPKSEEGVLVPQGCMLMKTNW